MKKILIILLILAIIPTVIFAKGFSFGIGATASTGSTISNIVENKTVDVSNFNYGAYANVKLFLVSVNATAFPKFDGGYLYFIGDLSANLAVDFSILRVQAGLSMGYFGGATEFKDVELHFYADDIKEVPLSVRAEIDLIFSGLNIGIWGLLPTEATFTSFDKIVEVKDKWKNASVGISLGVCF